MSEQKHNRIKEHTLKLRGVWAFEQLWESNIQAYASFLFSFSLRSSTQQLANDQGKEALFKYFAIFWSPYRLWKEVCFANRKIVNMILCMLWKLYSFYIELQMHRKELRTAHITLSLDHNNYGKKKHTTVCKYSYISFSFKKDVCIGNRDV